MNFSLNFIKLLAAFPVQLAPAILVVTSIGSVPQVSPGAEVNQESEVNQDSEENELDSKYQQATAELAIFSNSVARRQGDATEEDRKKLLELQQKKEQLLVKLISVKPEKDEYRFELSKLTAAKGDREKAMSILKQLAPEDVPGYLPAHFVLATQHFEKPATSRLELLNNLDTALKHVDHVLSLDETRLEAKLLKARILTRVQRYAESYKLYEELFESNPNYYLEMVALNKQLSREARNQPLFKKALASFMVLADKKENQSDDKRWVVIETGIAKTLQKLERFEEAETRLNEMLKGYAADPKGGARRVFVQRLLADTYVAWASNVAGSENAHFDSLPDGMLKNVVELNTKAYRNQPDNVLVLQNLTRLSLSSNEGIAAVAKSVYDPNADVNAPAAVLNQLGTNMLLNKKYSEAIRYYERARDKTPRDPAVLNNLAFAYLIAPDDERNEERALQLVNEAIRQLPADIPDGEKAKFLHTKATALKHMDRLARPQGR